MTRCPSAWPAWALAAALALPVLAQAQMQRGFPQNALRGQITVVQPPEVALNGRPARLAPGARIRGTDNMLVMSASIVGQPHPANYTLDLQGQLLEVWLLRPEEAKRAWPKTAQEAAALNFDPVAQTWSKR